jgi:hypothetical protein
LTHDQVKKQYNQKGNEPIRRTQRPKNLTFDPSPDLNQGSAQRLPQTIDTRGSSSFDQDLASYKNNRSNELTT